MVKVLWINKSVLCMRVVCKVWLVADPKISTNLWKSKKFKSLKTPIKQKMFPQIFQILRHQSKAFLAKNRSMLILSINLRAHQHLHLPKRNNSANKRHSRVAFSKFKQILLLKKLTSILWQKEKIYQGFLPDCNFKK